MKLVGLRKLAEAVGVDPGQLSREARKRGFPSHLVGAEKKYNPDEVKEWRSHNIRKKETGGGEDGVRGYYGEGEEGGEGRGGRKRAGAMDADNPFILLMTSGDASAIEISRAAVQLASRQVAQSAVLGTLGIQDLDGLKKSLGELRQAETDYIALEKERRSLIAREEVLGIVGACCSRLVRALSLLENTIATEFSIWLADPAIREMKSDDRARQVRAFVTKTCRQVRLQEADGIDKLIDAGSAEEDDE